MFRLAFRRRMHYMCMITHTAMPISVHISVNMDWTIFNAFSATIFLDNSGTNILMVGLMTVLSENWAYGTSPRNM